MSIKKMEKMRAQNNKLWMEMIAIAKKHPQAGSLMADIARIEKNITDTARKLGKRRSPAEIAALLDTLELWRIHNNTAWMRYMRMAFYLERQRMRTIMKQIADNDVAISNLRHKEISK